MRRLFSPWVLITYFAICAVAAIWYDNETPSHTRDSMAIVVAFIAGGAAIYSLLLNVQTLRATSAARFIERWNDPQMRDLREAMRSVVKGGSLEQQATQIELSCAKAEIANFFEELAISVLHNGADRHILKDFFRSPLCDAYRELESWIAEMRTVKQQPTACKHFEALSQRWSRESRSVIGNVCSAFSRRHFRGLTMPLRHHPRLGR